MTQTAHALPAPEIFKAYDIRGIVDKTLTAAAVRAIGHALGSEAVARGQKAIAVGRDGRLSGPELAGALADGIRSAGVDVVDIGCVPTPLTYFAAYQLGTHSCVSVTGSHNPPDYNGLKMVLGGQTLFGEQILALRQRIADNNLTHGNGTLSSANVVEDYIARIVDDVKLARPMKIVMDCGNGVAGAVAPELFKRLGCELVELYCDVDGNFPNHHPDPGKPENLVDLIAKVKSEKADLGLAFDGDGDRVGVVTNAGTMIYADRLLMLRLRAFDLAREALRDLAVERARDADELFLAREHLQPRHDRHRDPDRATPRDEVEVVPVVEEHLGHDVLGARVDLLLGATDVGVEVRRLEVFLGVAAAADAELGGRRVEVRVEVTPLVHLRDLLDQVDCVAVDGAAFAQRLAVALVVAADRQDVVDAEVAELDEEVLRLLLREAVAEHVRHRVDLVLVLDQRAEPERAGALALHVALDAAVGLFVDDLGRVARDVDEGRPVLHELVHEAEDLTDVPAALGRDDLEADERPIGAREMLGDLHGGRVLVRNVRTDEGSERPHPTIERAIVVRRARGSSRAGEPVNAAVGASASRARARTDPTPRGSRRSASTASSRARSPRSDRPARVGRTPRRR